MKVSLDGEKVKGFFLRHVEKIVIGAVVLLFVAFAFGAIKQDRYTQDPQKLSQDAGRARDHVASSQWNPKFAELESRDLATAVAAGREELLVAPFDHPALFTPPLRLATVKRAQPELLPLAALQVTSSQGSFAIGGAQQAGGLGGGGAPGGIGAPGGAGAPGAAGMPGGMGMMGGAGGMAGASGMGGASGRNNRRGNQGAPGMSPGGPGGMAGGSDARGNRGNRRGNRGDDEDEAGQGVPGLGGMAGAGGGVSNRGAVTPPNGSKLEGRRWVVITGLIPHADQLKKYADAFQDSTIQRPQDDVPKHVWFEIERAEVVPGTDVASLDEAAWQRLSVEDAYRLTKKWGTQSAEVVPMGLVGPGRLCYPLGPLADRQWDKSVAHLPEIGLAGQQARAQNQQGGGDDVDAADEFIDKDGDGVPDFTGGAGGARGNQMMGGMAPGGGAGGAAGAMMGGMAPGGGGAAGAMMGGMAPGGGAGAPGAMMGGMTPGGMMGAAGGAGGPGAAPNAGGTSAAGSAGAEDPFAGASGGGAGLNPGAMMGGMAPGGMMGGMAGGAGPAVGSPYRLFRFFDFEIEEGKTYRYRVKLVLTNPNHNLEERYVIDLESTKAPNVAAPWSEPSPEVTVGRPNDVLAGSVKPGKGAVETKATVMVRQWNSDDGTNVIVQEELFVGQVANFAKAEGKSWNPKDGSVQKLEDFEFATDMLLVDLRPGELLDKSEDLFGPAEMLFLSADGKLIVKSQLDDRPMFESDEELWTAEAKKPAKEGEGGWGDDFSTLEGLQDKGGAKRGGNSAD